MTEPNSNASEASKSYWRLVKPIWYSVSIYDGPETFLRQFGQLRPEVGHLFAATWFESEVCNGGLYQFFGNSTGVLAPEALEGLRAIGLPEWVEILAKARHFFGTAYPRDRTERRRLLPKPRAGSGGNGTRFMTWMSGSLHYCALTRIAGVARRMLTPRESAHSNTGKVQQLMPWGAPIRERLA